MRINAFIGGKLPYYVFSTVFLSENPFKRKYLIMLILGQHVRFGLHTAFIERLVLLEILHKGEIDIEVAL